MNRDTELLKTKKQDEEFHRSRRMFCIKDGEVKIAQKGTPKSHFEWFKDEGWTTENNWKNFFNTTIGGYFIPALNEICCFRGEDFSFNDEVIEKIKKTSSILKTFLTFLVKRVFVLDQKMPILIIKNTLKRVGVLSKNYLNLVRI